MSMSIRMSMHISRRMCMRMSMYMSMQLSVHTVAAWHVLCLLRNTPKYSCWQECANMYRHEYRPKTPKAAWASTRWDSGVAPSRWQRAYNGNATDSTIICTIAA